MPRLGDARFAGLCGWLPLLLAFALLAPDLAEPASQQPGAFDPVPQEEYPIYDRVIQTKFLTSQTALVVIKRFTVTRLGPDPEEKPPTRADFEARGFFNGLLQRDLVTDFILKIHRPYRLEPRFNFGVAYRLVSEEGGEAEVSLAPIPVEFSPPGYAESTIGVLEFSRVGFNRRRDQALVYVGNTRPDGTGGGFLVLLGRYGPDWTVLDTEVLWVARHDGSEE